MRTEAQQVALFNGMRASEVAELLQCSREHVLALIKSGAVAAVDISVGSRPEFRISRQSFEAFLQERKVA